MYYSAGTYESFAHPEKPKDGKMSIVNAKKIDNLFL